MTKTKKNENVQEKPADKKEGPIQIIIPFQKKKKNYIFENDDIDKPEFFKDRNLEPTYIQKLVQGLNFYSNPYKY